MSPRVILHCDANSYYASVECLYNPAIRNKPVVVGGDVEARHGIVLTKNQIAKKFGIQTGEVLWQAKKKCPDLIIVPPDYGLYVRFSGRMRKIYEQYSDRVESFGLDECWVDISAPDMTIAKGEKVANEIRKRVREELGITISVGVANNKIFAKLGSDMKKPDATTVIHPARVHKDVWPLPVGVLLFVGPATKRKLANIFVFTIGDLAALSPAVAQAKLGKNGLILKAYAMGLDRSPVMPCEHTTAIKSVGNSSTAPHDLETMDDVRCMVWMLAESVAARLRENGLKGKCVSINARTTDLHGASKQVVISKPTNLTNEIATEAIKLFEMRFADGFPYRSMGISVGMLCPEYAPVQLDLLGDETRRIKQEKLERSIDGLRSRFGHNIVQRGVVLTDRAFAKINPVDEHTIHPVPFYAG